jgi:hypothetical protein
MDERENRAVSEAEQKAEARRSKTKIKERIITA